MPLRAWVHWKIGLAESSNWATFSVFLFNDVCTDVLVYSALLPTVKLWWGLCYSFWFSFGTFLVSKSSCSHKFICWYPQEPCCMASVVLVSPFLFIFFSRHLPIIYIYTYIYIYLGDSADSFCRHAVSN
ncbi:hypothetical protein, unlikely [Trypanosoma brucei gambiense DAL972]|uniref:Uncharacterized protein n=1 Tax=Trypanosoma brucei gambiense (strain MHOM/CI/86/DAL972) TaxID=679716 RepID=D0AAU0_TRYB9|nr:hypothetical protein, unlikely [Trypanosoma brucei gambiense DAL972]CBH18791.1 hypothetical protein, unlikely [Trypanosoma brucei gambiense DAL972]|eukprot:XP_011781055.1 hypothetical protein, unlikely [Trypanosoma brucei gambiense DAL972]